MTAYDDGYRDGLAGHDPDYQRMTYGDLPNEYEQGWMAGDEDREKQL